MVKRYRKVPVEISAVQWTGTNATEIKEFCSPVEARYTIRGLTPSLDIYTLEGVMSASVGDYIIKGVDSECYPCKPGIFHKTYIEVPADIATAAFEKHSEVFDVVGF